MQFDTELKIKEFRENAIILKSYDKIGSILNRSKEERKKNIALGRKSSSLAKQLINNALEDFIKLLEDDNILVAEGAAECLYPLFPKKCIRILKQYSNTLDNEIEKYRVETIIAEFKNPGVFFVENFRKLYNVDDLSTLNREK